MGRGERQRSGGVGGHVTCLGVQISEYLCLSRLRLKLWLRQRQENTTQMEVKLGVQNFVLELICTIETLINVSEL